MVNSTEKQPDLEAKLQEMQTKLDEMEEKLKEKDEIIGRLEKENAELRAGVDTQKLARQVENWTNENQSESSDDEINVDNLQVATRFGRAKIDKQTVKEVLDGLEDPYKSEVRNFIKNTDIEGLQRYLNGLIDNWTIDKQKLKEVLESIWVWLYENWHILEDWKFWPQTLEAIKMLKWISEVKEKDKEGEADDVKVKEEVEEPKDRDVSAEDLVELPVWAKATFKEDKWVDRTREWEDQEVTIIVEVWKKIKEITVIVTVEGNKIRIQVEKEEEKKEDEVKVKEWEQDVPKDRDVSAEDLVEKPSDDAEVEFKEWSKVERDETGPQTVTVIVKRPWKEDVEIVITVTINGERMNVKKVEKEEEKKEEEAEFEKVTVKAEIAKPKDEEEKIKAEELLEWLPDWATADFDEDKWIDLKEEKEQIVKVLVKNAKWEVAKEFKIVVRVKEDKIQLEPQGKEEDVFEGITIKEEIVKPGEEEEVGAKDLVEWLPKWATVEFKDGIWIDKTKEWVEQEVTVVITIWDKTKEFEIVATVEGESIKLEDKEKKETAWFEGLKIEDLWEWEEDGNFKFKDWLVDLESGELTVNDRKFAKLEEGASWFGYLLGDKELFLWNFEDGKLNWKWVKFNSHRDEFERDEHRPANATWIKYCWNFENGMLNEWVQIISDSTYDMKNWNKFDLYIDINGWEPINCYTEDKQFSFEFENYNDGLYLKNWENGLRLKDANMYHAYDIVKILYDYKDKEGEFYVDFSSDAGTKTKKLLRKPATGDVETVDFLSDAGIKTKKTLRNPVTGDVETVHLHADDLIETIGWTEGLTLASWLNECRNNVSEQPEDLEGENAWVDAVKIDELWKYNEDGNFEMNGEIEQTDEKGTYIEIWLIRFYNDATDWFSYSYGGFWIKLWKYENWKQVWYWVEYAGTQKREWEYNLDGNRQWEWKITTDEGKEWWGKYENWKQVWHWVEYSGWEKREWEYNLNGNRQWEWIVTKSDWTTVTVDYPS